ncbi:unnamed protein product, partial [marine sediment metagenome]
MPEPLTSYLTAWREAYGHIYSALYNLCNDFTNAQNQATAHNWEGLATAFGQMYNDMYDATYHFQYGSPNLRTTTYNATHWIDLNWGDGDGVDMDGIINAMLTANFDQLQKFVGLVD